MKFTGLSPILETNDIRATMDFYTSTLGFSVRGTFENGAGETVWCDLVRDGVSIMFSLPNEHMNYGTVLLTGSLYINVQEVDAVWEQLKDKCTVVYPPENFVYEMREFAIRDNNGYVLNFAEPVKK